MDEKLPHDQSYHSLYTSVVRLYSRADCLVLRLKYWLLWLPKDLFSQVHRILDQCERSTVTCKRGLCSGAIWLSQRWILFFGGDPYSPDLPWRDLQDLHATITSTLTTLEELCIQLTLAKQNAVDTAALQRVIDEIGVISERADRLRSIALLFFDLHLGSMPKMTKKFFLEGLYHRSGTFPYEVLEVRGYPIGHLRRLLLRHSELDSREFLLTSEIPPGVERIVAFSEMLQLKEEFEALVTDWSVALFCQRKGIRT